jgi:signal transduction histidine kinase
VAQSVGVAVENARLFAEVKEKTSELAKANEELRAATRAKSEFIAAMSHELRTPLHIIIGHSDLTRDGTFGPVTAQQQNVMVKIARNAKVLLKMVENVLTLSRLDAKKMSLELETVTIPDILEEVEAHVQHLNRDHQLEVKWRVDEAIPPIVTDAMKLEEILQNLIANAFKFTPEGQIAVEVRDLPGKRRVEFIVSDTGIGIQAANLQRIFEDFEQVKTNRVEERQRGAGLGLSIVRKYLDLMHGDIHVESQPGHGTRFTFWIPYCPPAQA